jgi:hypothetical protein
LASWREFHGWDRNGTLGAAEVSFDLDQLELTPMPHGDWPKVTIFHSVDTDSLGKAAGGSRSPGPFANLKEGCRKRNVDPRQ